MTSAVKVTARPTSAAEPDGLSVVNVKPLLIEKAVGTLAEAVTSDPGKGVKTADSCKGDVAAANDVPQVTVADGADCAEMGTAAHPLIGMPPFSKATVPIGATSPGVVVTVDTKVTAWLVTGGPPPVTTESDVVLAAIWVRVAGWIVAAPSVASTVNVPGVPANR